MSTETSATRIASLVLRLTLAVIFIWHGVDKLRSDNWATWGADWSARAHKRNSEPPPRALAKLEKLRDERPRQWLMPESDKADEIDKVSDEKAKELARQRHKEAEFWLRYAYVSDAPDENATLQFAAVQYAVTWGEILGGVALLLGLLTRLAALGLIVIQLGAIYFVTLPLGLTGEGGAGYEYNLVLIATCLVLMIQGPGGWSLDHCLHWGRKERAAAVPQQTGAVSPPAQAPS
jgi:uncharacterized membrane protein YphA (DoxX/SURF4 family)